MKPRHRALREQAKEAVVLRTPGSPTQCMQVPQDTLGTRGERDARGMAKAFELACVRACSDIDRAETLSEHHWCRHGLPAHPDASRLSLVPLLKYGSLSNSSISEQTHS
jgi:hypothetical protein